jgi:Pilus formation protein N terminal region
MSLRFRITTLLWLTVVVVAFFVGQRSDEISSHFNRWWQVTRIRFGSEVRKGYAVVMWPPHSATINEDLTIQKVSIDNPNICTVTAVSDRQLRVTPTGNGKTSVHYILPGQATPCRFDITVENGNIADWMLTGPPRRKANGT